MRRIHLSTGIVVPVGATICTLCRKSLLTEISSTYTDNQQEKENIPDATVREDYITCTADVEEIGQSCTSSQRIDELESITDYSYEQDSQSQHHSQTSEASACFVEKREILNAFLSISNMSPVKEKKLPLQKSSTKTQSNCARKALQCLEAICDTICPGEGKLLEESVRSMIYTQMRDTEKTPMFDETSFILKEVYLNAATWVMQRQILSILARDRTFNEVQQLLPNVSYWKFSKAKSHCEDVGCGMPLTVEKKHRNKINEEQLEHFIDYIVSSDIVKDLPYGTKTMKLTTGQIVDVPNLIRSLAPSSLIDQYTKLCDIQGISHLGVSTMFKILDDCAASVRKCIEGLDYYVAEGGRSFSDLEELVQTLPIEEDRKKTLTSRLLSAKSYLKTEYKVHIKPESKTADHCRKFALGEKGKCNHPHEEVCEQCENVESVLSDIATIVNDSEWENEDSVLFQVNTASENILNWKKHIVRSRNQEEARLDLVGNMTEGQVVITSDWAMKMLPRKYREGQTDWFAKRGLNWHISVTMYRENGEIKNLTHVHIFSSQVSQDAATTVSLIKDTVEDLNTTLPDVKELHFMSDNAGCYKNTLMMSTLKHEVGSKVKSYNFSESQDGKGPCDRRASHIKAAIKRYINEGHNVTTAEEMKQAIDSRQSGPFRVKVVDTITNVDTLGKPLKLIPNISSLFNFVFEDDGLHVYQAYKIGKGDLVPWNSIGKPSKSVELLVKRDWTSDEVRRPMITPEQENTEDNSGSPAKKKKEI